MRHVRFPADTPRASDVSARCEACGSTVRLMTTFRAERAVSPTEGSVAWVVIDGDYGLHAEGCAFLAGLRGRDRSVNTERLYAGRVALFLSWCAAEGADWKTVHLGQMVRFKQWLVTEPLPPRRRMGGGPARLRSHATADAILGTVCEFFRFCAQHDLVGPDVVRRLHEPRYLRFLPPGYEAGEDDQFRTVRSRVLKFAVPDMPFEFIEPDQVESLAASAGNARDQFLVALVAMTGMRIGEALGLHREDMHFLTDSRGLGCPVTGPHLHVRRREDNPNGALAKSRFPRSIPVPEEAVTLYADYAHERHTRLGSGDESPLVFVNLYRAPLGEAVSYQNIKQKFDRLARSAGFTVRPHLLRHTTATTWLRQGTSRDTVQHLLGHVSPSSMQPYLHFRRRRQAIRGRARRRMGTEQPMTTPALTTLPDSLPYRLDHDAWRRYLREDIDPEWRPDEFDPQRWLFTGDPDNPRTTSTRCKVRACDTVVNSRCLCNQCQRAWEASQQDEEEFLKTYQPSLVRHRRTGQTCVVGSNGVRCQRRRHSNRTGLCHAHTTMWNRRGKRLGMTFQQWCLQARALPARDACSVLECAADAKLDVALCGIHFRDWRRTQNRLPHEQRETPEQWATNESRQLQVNQFSLALATPTVREELLYALQQRDAQGQKIDPVAMRSLVNGVAGLEALAITAGEEVLKRITKTANTAAYTRLLTRIIGLKFEQFRGIRHTGKDVWECLALDLEAPRAGRRPNRASIDFTPISQPWLREAAKQWVHTFRPDHNPLKRTLHACTLASHALAQRPGGGRNQRELTFADMTVIFESIKNATHGEGLLYDSRYRRGLWAQFHKVIDFGRSTESLAELPGTFHRHSSHKIGTTEVNEDEIGKAIPETVIAQLDNHLGLLGTDSTYGRAWSPAATGMMFRAAYQVLRDTGRRPSEVVSLPVACLESSDGEYALIYDNHKNKRMRRRLPITASTAGVIQQWQDYRSGLDLPASTQGWLFPSWGESSGPAHLTTNRLVRAIKAWVASIPLLHSDLPGPDGTPLPFDRSLIYPYAFRHSYAQRHADAGVAVEILKELMDHKDLSVTQGYYTVSLKRKQQAIKIMSRYVHDRSGMPRPGSDSAAGYGLKSVAVPFGNCIEPSNVIAGGKQCPIRFQCAGCGFYRPDPSYLPAIEEHINALKSDRETAAAMDADDFVIRNLTDQADAFTHVAASMREKLHSLPEDERAEVEHASTVLRKVRAGRDVSQGRPLLPLTVKDKP